MEQHIDKNAVIRAMISVIEDDGEPDKIFARDLDEYEDPKNITGKDESRGFVPDMAVYYDEAVDIYEVEISGEINIEKWLDLQSYARKHNGNLYLVVPDVVMDKVKKVLKRNNIGVGLLYFNT